MDLSPSPEYLHISIKQHTMIIVIRDSFLAYYAVLSILL